MRRLQPWLPAFAYMVLIWVLSSKQGQFDLPDLPFRDKAAHFLEYALLGALNAYACTRSWPLWRARKALAIAALLTSAWGYTDELHQAFVPGRNADFIDWVADTLGAIFGVSVFGALDLWRSKRGSNARAS